jgi:hypothetical protein
MKANDLARNADEIIYLLLRAPLVCARAFGRAERAVCSVTQHLPLQRASAPGVVLRFALRARSGLKPRPTSLWPRTALELTLDIFMSGAGAKAQSICGFTARVNSCPDTCFAGGDTDHIDERETQQCCVSTLELFTVRGLSEYRADIGWWYTNRLVIRHRNWATLQNPRVIDIGTNSVY